MTDILNPSETAMTQLLEQMALQQAEMKALRDKLSQQESELSQQKAVLASLKVVEPSQPVTTTQPASTSSRRRMLKKMGAVAAGLAVAGAIGSTVGGQSSTALAYGGSASIAGANGDDAALDGGPIKNHPPMKIDISGDHGPKRTATGDAMVLGTFSQASSANSSTGADTTRIYNPANGTGRLADVLYQVQNYTNRFPTPLSNYRYAIVAQSTGDDNAGANRCAVFGLTDSYGVSIYAQSELGSALAGDSASHYGGYFSGGRANIYLASHSGSGAPTIDYHNVGELYQASSGNLFLCVVGGTPGTWRKIGGAATAGALHVLPTPDRFLDTRSFVQSGDTVGTIPAGGTRSYLIGGGTGQNSVVIPANAIAVVGNVTAFNGPSASGGNFLKVYSADSSEPPVATVNFNSTNPVGNSFVCALSSTGRIKITALKEAHAIIDITGYYL